MNPSPAISLYRNASSGVAAAGGAFTQTRLLLICACISATEVTFSIALALSAIATAKPPFSGGVVMHFVLQGAAADQLGVFNRLTACGGVDDVGVFAILDTVLNVRTAFMHLDSPDAG